VRALFVAFADIYDTNGERIAAIKQHLVALLGRAFLKLDVPGVQSDGVIIKPCGLSTAYLVVLEVKNEIGEGMADPYNKGNLAYRKYCCPSIILVIAGPWLRVLGGVYLESSHTAFNKLSLAWWRQFRSKPTALRITTVFHVGVSHFHPSVIL
jgi:hypothetical protein